MSANPLDVETLLAGAPAFDIDSLLMGGPVGTTGDPDRDEQIAVSVAATRIAASANVAGPDPISVAEAVSYEMRSQPDVEAWLDAHRRSTAARVVNERLLTVSTEVMDGTKTTEQAAEDVRRLSERLNRAGDPLRQLQAVSGYSASRAVRSASRDYLLKAGKDPAVIGAIATSDMRALMRQETDAAGGLDYLEGFVRSVIPIFDWSQSVAAASAYVQSGRNLPLINTSVFDGYKTYKDIYNAYWNLPPEDRVLWTEEIHDFVKTISRGNIFNYTSLMSPFTDPNLLADQKIDIAFEALDAATLGAAFFPRVIRNLYKAGKVSHWKRAIDLLPEDARRQVLRVALNQPDRAKAARFVDPTDAAMDVVPGMRRAVEDTETALPPPTGILKEMQDEVAEGADRIRSILDEADWETRAFVDEAVARKVQAESLAGVKEMPDVADARIISSDGSGFTIEITPRITSKLGMSLGDAENHLARAKAKLVELEAKEAWLESDNLKAWTASLEPSRKEIASQIAEVKRDIRALEREVFDLQPENIPPTTKTTVFYGRNETGQFFGRIPAGSGFASSNEVVFKAIDPDIVGDATALGYKIDAVREYLTMAFDEAVKGVSRTKIPVVGRSQMDELIEAEIKGDEAGKIFTIGELRAMGFNGAQVRAYYLRRALWDKLWFLKNDMTRRQLGFDGYKYSRLVGIKSGEKGYTEAFVRPVKHEGDFLPNGVTRIYDGRVRKVVDANRADIKNRIESGEWLVYRTRKKVDAGKEQIEYALLRSADMVTDLPPAVLNYRRGYVPMMRKGVHYIVTRSSKVVSNGVEQEGEDIVRFFRNKADADKYALTRPTKEGEKYSVHFSEDYANRNPDFKFDQDLNGFGGLFVEERAKNPIYIGWEDEVPERLNANEAFEAYINHIALRYPTNEFRMNVVSRFLNTYGKFLESPDDWLSGVKSGTDEVMQQAIETVRDRLKDMLYIQTRGERSFALASRRIADTIAGAFPGSKMLSAKILDYREFDVFGTSRAMAFHALLGWWNPRQLVVQSLGSTLAMSMHPIEGAKALPRYAALRAAMYRANIFHDEAYVRHVANTLGVAAGYKPDDFVAMVKLFRKTGIHMSVRTTADYAAATSAMPISFGALKSVANKSLFFYREGELVVRGNAWLIAGQLYLKRTGKQWRDLTSSDADTIVKDSLKLMLNLNRANRAPGWQTGFLSLPTQFLQILMKFGESMAPKFLGMSNGNWTLGQKTAVALGTGAIYGLAGIPMGEWVFGEFRDYLERRKVEGKNDANLFDIMGFEDEDMIKIWRGGILEWAARSTTGADVDLSARTSIPAGFEELFNMMFEDNPDLVQILIGAAGGVFGRGWVHLQKSTEILGLPKPEGLEDDPRYPAAVLEAAKIISTFNSVQKANFYWSKMAFYASRKGVPFEKIRDLNEHDFPTVFAQALGFVPNDIKYRQEELEYNRVSNKEKREVADALLDYHFRSMPLDGYTSEESVRYHQMVMYELTSHYDEKTRSEIYAEVGKRLKGLDREKFFSTLNATLDNIYGEAAGANTTRGRASIALNPTLTREALERRADESMGVPATEETE